MSKKKRILFLVVMAIAMMTVCPQKMWADTTPDYLCFTAEEAGAEVGFAAYITGVKEGETAWSPTATLEYSTDGTTWYDYSLTKYIGSIDGTPETQEGTSITLTNVNDKVYFRAKGTNGTNSTFSKDASNFITFTASGKVAASGNIMSLLDATCQSTTVPEYAFISLFFECTNLTTAPELPATTLSEGCYYEMFAKCTSLTTAPNLPAKTLVTKCYDAMFAGCTSLNSVTVSFKDWAPTGVTDATNNWLSGVSSTGTFCCSAQLSTSTRSESTVPSNWTVSNYSVVIGDNSLDDLQASGTDKYAFTPTTTGFYTFTSNNANVWLQITDGSSVVLRGTESCGGKLSENTTYTIELSNMSSSDAITGLTLTVANVVPQALSLGDNSVTIPKYVYVPGFCFTPEESGTYKFTISDYGNNNQIALYEPAIYCNSKGEVIATDLVAGTTYYVIAGGKVSSATINVSKYTVMDKVVYNSDTKTLTFYHDAEDHSSEGTIINITDISSQLAYQLWSTYKSDAEKIVFDESFANAELTITYGWFQDFSKVTEVVGMEYLNMSNVTYLGNMFNGCESLTSITLPSTLKTIGEAMFSDCPLTSIDIPSSVQSIGNLAFYRTVAPEDQVTVTYHSIPDVATNAFTAGTGDAFGDFDCEFILALDDNSYVDTDVKNPSLDLYNASYTRTMKNQWGTIVLPFDAKNGDDYDLYRLTGSDSNGLVLTKIGTNDVSETLSAGTPAFVRRSGNVSSVTIKASDTSLCTTISAGESAGGFTVNGAYDYTLLNSNTNAFIVSNNSFWSVGQLLAIQKSAGNEDAKVYCSPFHAYLISGSNAKSVNVTFVDDQTIDAIEALNAITEGKAEYYDLNGRRIADLQNGVNIVKYNNGITKKVIIK